MRVGAGLFRKCLLFLYIVEKRILIELVLFLDIVFVRDKNEEIGITKMSHCYAIQGKGIDRRS
jgi:hypothetical protein